MGLLYFGPICWRKPLVGRVLREHGRGVLEALQGFTDIVRNGDVDVIAGLVPVDFQTAVVAARWVDGD